jgi:hypothetical protein
VRGEERGVIHPDNEDVWTLLMICNTQWLCGPDGGIYGINLSAVWDTARALGLHPDMRLAEKVKIYENEVVRHAQRDREGTGCNAKKKDECAALYGPHLEWACKQCQEPKP